jgi:hypothetical protein
VRLAGRRAAPTRLIATAGRVGVRIRGVAAADVRGAPGASMSSLSRLFGKSPPPPPPTLAERISALGAAPAEAVASAALGEPDADVRLAAIRLLPDGAVLRSVAGLADAADGAATPVPAAARHAAQARLAELIDAGSLDFATFRAGRERRPETLAVAALCQDPEHLRSALARIDEPALLAQIAVDGPSSRIRQLAAAAIDEPGQLAELLKQARGKDKAVYRIIKQKCDALTALQREAQDAAREAEAVCASLERHAARIHDPIYAATLEMLAQRWRALATRPEPGIEQRGRDAIGRCQAVIAAHEHALARQAAERTAEAEARDARARAHEAERRLAADQAEADARAQAQATAARAAEERARAERLAAEEQAGREIASLIRLARAALAAGNTRKAARFRQALEETAQALAALPAPLARSLEQLDGKLNELRQWKDYVVAPKRIELIEEMEALVGSTEEPEALAEHIRALQQEWRTINKGLASDASAEAARFQHAYQAAYRPCQEFHAAQAAVRRANLAARQQVLERLKAVEASQAAADADRRLLAQVLREAPREWRGHSPVDRDAARALETEFNRSMDRLRGLLTAWHDRNEADKQSLIAQAKHCAALEDTTRAIDGVKRLQTLWKETGPASHERAQALWDEFRAQCDAIFQRREQAFAAQAAALAGAKASAVALCTEVEQAAAAAERAAAKARIAQWRGAFDALGELPAADGRGLRDRFERALGRYEARLAEQGERDAETAVANLLEAARHVGEYARAVARAAPPAECEALRSAAEAFVAGVQRWPPAGLAAVKQALARAASAAQDDAARERALRLLCVRGEILTSTPTPSADEVLRRDYQMRLLVEGMGQGRPADERDWDALLLEWVAVGAAPPGAHAELERRFKACLARRPAKTPAAAPFRNHDGRDARGGRPRGDRGDRGDRGGRFGDRGRSRPGGPR